MPYRDAPPRIRAFEFVGRHGKAIFFAFACAVLAYGLWGNR